MTALTLVALVMATFVAVRRLPGGGSFRLRPAVSAYSVVVVLFILYVLLPSILIVLNNGNYTWAVRYDNQEYFRATLGVCLVALVSFIYGDTVGRTVFSGKIPKRLSAHCFRPDSGDASRVYPISLVALGLAAKLAAVISAGGPEAAILRISNGIQEASGLAADSPLTINLIIVSGIADVGATWLVLRALRRRTALLPPLLLLGTILSCTFLVSGKRFTVVLPILAIAIGYHVYRRKLNAPILLPAVAAVLGIGLVSLSARVLLPAALADVHVDLERIPYAEGSIVAFYFYSLEFSTVEMMTVAIQSSHRINHMFGGQWNGFIESNLSPFLYSIPRAIWPMKPELFTDYSYAISSIVTGGDVDEPEVGYASTIIGTSYIGVGGFGVAGSAIALGLLTAWIDSRFVSETRWTPGNIMLYAYGLVVVFHLFRQGSPAWTFVVSTTMQYGSILAIILLSSVERTMNHHKSFPANRGRPADAEQVA